MRNLISRLDEWLEQCNHWNLICAGMVVLSWVLIGGCAIAIVHLAR